MNSNVQCELYELIRQLTGITEHGIMLLIENI